MTIGTAVKSASFYVYGSNTGTITNNNISQSGWTVIADLKNTTISNTEVDISGYKYVGIYSVVNSGGSATQIINNLVLS